MNLIPDPLHPAVVHFPIVFILIGTLTAVAAVLWRKGPLPVLAAVFLGLGAVGVWTAIQTGESDGGLLDTMGREAESLVEAHEMWAERTLITAAIAAAAAIVSAVLFRFPRMARGTGIVAVLAAFIACYAVYETGHRGGALVFRHGAGVNLVSGSSAAAGEGAGADTTLRNEPATDDDHD